MTIHKSSKSKIESVIAKSDDGTIQITFTIAFEDIKKAQDTVVNELSKEIEVPGFRKGMAPPDKVLAGISKNTLLEKTLSKILPKITGDAIVEHKIKPAIYPKFELIKAVDNEPWEVRATTCELPEIKLGDYKKEISGIARSNALWTPGKDKDKKEFTREEKEQEVIKVLLDKKDIKIPHLLIEEEVNGRLAKLLERLEKLGLNLDSYLASLNKTAQSLRQEYETQAKNAILLDLALNQVAKEANLTVDAKEIDAAIQAAQADPKLAEELNTPERKSFLEAILKRRHALDYLVTLTNS